MLQAAVDREHGEFDHVGGGALDDAVDGGSFGQRERLAAGVVGEERQLVDGADALDAAAAAEDRGDVAVAAAFVERVDHELGDAAVGGEIAVDERGGFFLRDAEALGEAERALAVDDAEVDGLGAAALGRRTSPSGTPKTWLATSVWMSSSRSKAAHIDGVLRIVGQDAQLDLRVVGGEQLPAGLAGDERGADFAAFVGADRDVLQVRVAGAEPAGGGDDLVERRVNAARLGVDHRRQGVDVGALELRVLAVLDDLRGQRVRCRPVARGRRRRCSAPVLVFLTTGRPSSWNSTWRSCLGEAMLSGWPASSSISCSRIGEPLAVAVAEFGQACRVDADADELELGEHFDERDFDCLVELR